MQSNFIGLNDLPSSTADPRAAATDGEVAPHPVSIDIGHQNTAQHSGKVPANARQEDRSDVARNIVLFEGSAGEVHRAVAELQLKLPSATLEPTEETARHRQLFVRETDGLPATAPADAITVAVRFETAPPQTPTALPDALLAIKAITDRWRKTLTTGHVYFDTHLVASAVAMVYCAGPRTGDVSCGLVGSLGGYRQAYYRLKRHFYKRAPRWNAELSPSKILFSAGSPDAPHQLKEEMALTPEVARQEPKTTQLSSDNMLESAAVAMYERAKDHAARGGLRGAYPGESLGTPVLWMKDPKRGYTPRNVEIVPLAVSLLAEFGFTIQEATVFLISARQGDWLASEQYDVQSVDGAGLSRVCPGDVLAEAGFTQEEIVSFLAPPRGPNETFTARLKRHVVQGCVIDQAGPAHGGERTRRGTRGQRRRGQLPSDMEI